MEKLWYALQTSPDDCEWGDGSESRDEAIAIMMADDDYTQIAVISGEGNAAICIEVIRKEDIDG